MVVAADQREDITMKHVILGAALSAALAIPAFATDYTIMAPASPGGGWDQTARTMQEVLQAEGISGNVQVQNVPGAGGTVGLAQFVSTASGDPSQLIVGGYVMVGAILTNASPVSLADVTPIARLTGEAVAIVVPAASPIQDINGLVEAMKADPGAVSWAGGSAGGVDHITVGLLAKAAGVDPTKINYVAFSGGGEALAAILGNQVTAGISGLGEFLPQVQAGTMRLLAVSSGERIEGVDAPTLAESGYDVVVQNWRMVAAAPGLTAEQKAAVTADIEKLNASAGWQKALADKGWANTFLAGPEFDAQLAKDIEATNTVLKDIGLVQ
jgi:putative tricarboxylic transport membrane protein